jgi:hypothetical protein
VKRALVVLCALTVVAPARAETSGQVRALARQAEASPHALAQLREVRKVDGRAFDLGRVLATRNLAELRARLRTLEGGAAPPSRQFAARAEARRILRERRFHRSPVPRPFHGALVWLGGKLQPVARAFDWLAARIPGGSWTLWIVLALLVVAASGVAAGRVAQRRGGLELERGVLRGNPASRLDPRELERAADEAEAAGDAARALRLRFRAGLLRLGRAQVVPLRESLTSGEARRIIRLPEFDSLARTHDEVVYGGRHALREDAVVARERWPRVLEAKGVRT